MRRSPVSLWHSTRTVFQVSANQCKLFGQMWQNTSWDRECITECWFEAFSIERMSGHPVFVRSSRGSFVLLVSMLLLLVASVSTPSPLPYKLVAEKDSTYTTNASENAVRRKGMDSSLRKYSFMALSHAREGTVYNATLPPFLDGIAAQAIWIPYASLKSQSVIFNEFTIPGGAVVAEGPVIVLIYRKIFNFTVYSLPMEYDFAGPVVGVVAYASTNISFNDDPIPEANFTSPNSPIVVHVPISKAIGRRAPLCAFFGVDGSVVLQNVSSLPNVCTFVNLGDVSLVLPAAQAPPTLQPPTSYSPAAPSMKRTPAKRKTSISLKVVLVGAFGAFAGLVFLGGLIVFGPRVVERIRIAVMEHLADHGEPLQTALIGQTRAPTAAGVRTRPTLETDKFLAERINV